MSEHQKRPIDTEENPFHQAWEEGSKNPMTEAEVDDFVERVRKERKAARS